MVCWIFFLVLWFTLALYLLPLQLSSPYQRFSCPQGLITAVMPPSKDSLSSAACTDYSSSYSVSSNNHISAAFCSSYWLAVKLQIDINLALVMFLVGSIYPLWCLLWPCPSEWEFPVRITAVLNTVLLLLLASLRIKEFSVFLPCISGSGLASSFLIVSILFFNMHNWGIVSA